MSQNSNWSITVRTSAHFLVSRNKPQEAKRRKQLHSFNIGIVNDEEQDSVSSVQVAQHRLSNALVREECVHQYLAALELEERDRKSFPIFFVWCLRLMDSSGWPFLLAAEARQRETIAWHNPTERVLDVPVPQTMEVEVVPVLGLPVRQNVEAHDRTPRPVLEQSWRPVSADRHSYRTA